MSAPTDTAAPSPAPATPGPLRQPLFFRIWLSSLISNFGSLIQAVGAAWLMTSLSHSADTVALVTAASSVPMLAFALGAGAIADIYDRRSVMLVAQSLMFVISAALTVMTYLGHITPFWLLVFTFLIGCGNALNSPAWQASVGEQVPREQLPRAIALNAMGFNLARSLGPGVGGLIVAVAGATTAFGFNALSYLGLIAVLASWRRPKLERPLPAERLVPAMAAGLQYVQLSPVISAILLRAFAFGLAGSAIWALTPLLARDVLHGGAETYGLLLGALGLGAVAGALASTRLRARFSAEMVVRGSALMFGASIGVTAMSPWLPLTLVVLLFGGAAWVLTNSSFNITVQAFAPGWVVGRAMSLFQTAMFGGLALGSWIFGLVAQHIGLQASIGVSAAATAATVVLGLRRRLPTKERPDLAPIRGPHPFTPPALEEPSGGVVAMSVEYRIAQADAPAFLEAMTEKRRIRRRDGARRWSLLQDMFDPELWIERYETPNWVEHLRQRHRTTRADQHIEETVRAFHQGEAPPIIRRFLMHTPAPMRDPDHGAAAHPPTVETTLP